MKVLVACEFSGIVREAFRKRGHDAWSCDLLPTEIPGQHIQGDVVPVLSQGWDLIVAHPPCTFIANSGARWLFEKPGRWGQLFQAVTFFLKFFDHAPRVAVENPQPHKWGMEMIGRRFDQKVQPYEHGHKQKKGVCLWLKGLPILLPSKMVGPPPKDKVEAKKWEGCWREPPGPDQAKNRSRTFQGIADAMADQWGGDALKGDKR